jgi:DNA recombination protein RmuC
MNFTTDGLVIVALALLTGLAAGWFLARARASSAAAVAQAEADGRLAVARAEVSHERQAAVERSKEAEAKWADLQQRLLTAEREARTAAADLAQAREARVRLETEVAKERLSYDERIAAVKDAERRLAETFDALSAKALDASSARFLELASTRFATLKSEAEGDLERRQAEIGGVVAPMRDALQKIESSLAAVEQSRQHDRGAMGEQLSAMASAHQSLASETQRLVMALQAPHVRGRWGELQLRRVVELAGLEEHCDFETQQSMAGDDGVQRPDLVVTLPGNRTVVVDAKAPVMAFLEAASATDEATRVALLRDHAAQVRAHVTKLGAKAYWARLGSTPDFVVLFLPGESFFSAAVQHDPSLFEYGVGLKVFVAGPFTLLALLRTVAHGWTAERLQINAQIISEQGRELFDRLATMTGHFASMRGALQRAVDAHNEAIGSLESRVLPAARRLKELGVRSAKDLATLSPVEQTPRRLQAADMVAPPEQLALDAELLGTSVNALQPGEDD